MMDWKLEIVFDVIKRGVGFLYFYTVLRKGYVLIVGCINLLL